MRTTVVIVDSLAREAKKYASARGISLSELICEALRTTLATPSGPPARAFRMITFGDVGERKHVKPSEMSAALDDVVPANTPLPRRQKAGS